MMTNRKAHVFLILMVGLFILLMFSGCSWRQRDKCWVSLEKYNQARTLYDDLGSLDQVEARLVQSHWRKCEIRQALYWLEKDFYLDEE